MLLGTIFGTVDYIRATNGKKPIFKYRSINVYDVYNEGELTITEYYGLGYKIVMFSSDEKPKFLLFGLGTYAWFIGNESDVNFEINIKEQDKKSDDIILKELASSYKKSGEIVSSKIYSYGLDEIKITIDNKKYLLEEALEQNKIVMNAITIQLNDEEHLYDGGTTIYRDSNSKKVAGGNLTIIICNAAISSNNFNKDIYIGNKDMIKEESFCK